MKKRIITVVLILVVITLIIICLYDRTIKLNGKVLYDGNIVPIEVTITYKNYSYLIDFKKMGGATMVININGNEDIYIRHDFPFSTLKPYDFYVVNCIGYYKNKNTMGAVSLYFDKNMKNVIIKTKDYNFISSNEEFFKKVNRLDDNIKRDEVISFIES